jgi:hypothetical protein
MKFKCIKDFWMDLRSSGDERELAFKEGNVYSFSESDADNYYPFKCSSSDLNCIHYMTRADMSEYFIQVAV